MPSVSYYNRNQNSEGVVIIQCRVYTVYTVYTVPIGCTAYSYLNRSKIEFKVIFWDEIENCW